MTSPIRIERDGPVATLTIDRPAQHNAVSYEMWGLLGEAARGLAADPTLRVVVLTGAGGRAFSAGADIKDFAAHRSSSEKAAEYARVFEGALEAVETLQVPVIAMIDGICVGGGAELACCADLRIASDASTFAVPVARVGVLLGYAEMRRLLALVGRAAAADLLLTARTLDAHEAARVGLVHRVVARDDLRAEVYGLAERMAGFAPLTQAGHKHIIRIVGEDPAGRYRTPEEKALPLSIFDSVDAAEGYRAFVEKRAPRFTGR